MFAVLSACSISAEEVSTNSEMERELTIAHSTWEESAALAHLTEVILEDDFGYEVELDEATPEEAFEAVASGEADVFQGIWRPRHNEFISAHEGDIGMLGGWLFGTTRASLAAPAYMDVRNLSDIEDSGAERAIVLEPEASGAGAAPAEVFEKYGLEPSVYSDSSAMMEEVESLYEAEKPFVMLAYAPHWMNLEYDLVYLEEPEGERLLADMNRPATLHSAAKSGLSGEDPIAHALLAEVNLTVPEMESLQLEIHDAKNPTEGARAWAGTNGELINMWTSVARDSGG